MVITPRQGSRTDDLGQNGVGAESATATDSDRFRCGMYAVGDQAIWADTGKALRSPNPSSDDSSIQRQANKLLRKDEERTTSRRAVSPRKATDHETT